MARAHAPAPAKPGPIVYTDAVMLATLRRLALGEPTLGRAAFLARRHEDDPSYPLYERRFGSWSRALELAGLRSTVQPAHLQGATTKWSLEQLVTAVQRYLAETGSSSAAGYVRWRESRADEALPPLSTIRFRLGSWSRATRQACACPPSSLLPLKD